MKKISILIVSIFFCYSLQSCQKTKKDNPQSEENPIVKIVQSMTTSSSDFFITVSSSNGVSVYGKDTSCKQPSTMIEAASKNEINVGNLTVNDVTIPFNKMSYWKQCDTSVFIPSMVIGKINNYQLTGSGFPSFKLSGYSPKVDANLTFTGLSNYKLSRNSSLTLNWTPDNKMPENSKAILLLYWQNDQTNEIKSITINTSDDLGTYTFSNSTLSQFNDYSNVKILYFRGYNTTHRINNKAVGLNFISFNYATINFAN